MGGDTRGSRVRSVLKKSRMSSSQREKPAGPSRLTAVLGLVFTVVGVGILASVGANHSTALHELQDGIELLLQSAGAIAIGIGLLGLVIEACTGRRVASILNFALLVATGLAVYGRDVWLILGMVLFVMMIVLNGYLSRKVVDEESPEDA